MSTALEATGFDGGSVCQIRVAAGPWLGRTLSCPHAVSNDTTKTAQVAKRSAGAIRNHPG